MDNIEQAGTVISMQGSVAEISVCRSSGCGACESNGHCGVERKDHILHIVDPGLDLKPGDAIIVVMHKSSGLIAVALAYMIPLAILFVMIFFLNNRLANKSLVVLLSLFFVTPYYLILWLVRDNLKQTFTFHLRRPQ